MKDVILNLTDKTITVAIISSLSTLFVVYLAHVFSKRRMVTELLFNARREAYTEFIKNFGMAFGPETMSFENFNQFKIIETEYERSQKISRIFSQCRLVANTTLEKKLRHLYDLVIKDTEVKNSDKTERDYIGYEIEALMRYDLKTIGYIELCMWRVYSYIYRKSKK